MDWNILEIGLVFYLEKVNILIFVFFVIVKV